MINNLVVQSDVHVTAKSGECLFKLAFGNSQNADCLVVYILWQKDMLFHVTFLFSEETKQSLLSQITSMQPHAFSMRIKHGFQS